MTSRSTFNNSFQPLFPFPKIKPFVKWAGGKRKLLEKYFSYFPKNFNSYFEPFVGGGAVLLGLLERCPSMNATVMDVNAELVNSYNVIKSEVEDLITLLKRHKKKHNADYYYQIRSIDRDPDYNFKFSTVERAARIIYLNKTCFNGLYRVNSQGFFNVPIGEYHNPLICDAENLRNVSNALRNVTILQLSFEKVEDLAKEGDFIYFDPPYHPISLTASFTSYAQGNFNEDDQHTLQKIFKKLDKRGCYVALSNSRSEFILNLYKYLPNGCIKVIHAARAINSKGEKRGKIPEVLILGQTL